MIKKLLKYLFDNPKPCEHKNSTFSIHGAWYYKSCPDCGRKSHGSYGIEESEITDEDYYLCTEDEEGARISKIDKLLEE